MKKQICLISIILGLLALTPTAATADSEVTSVTGAADGLFATGTTLAGVTLDSLDLGTGVFIDSDGSGTGTFHAVLSGHLLLGQHREIIVEGNVSAGVPASGGQANFSGTATVDLGDGTLPLPGIPFSVTVTADGLVLVLGSTSLPVAGLTVGTIAID